MNNVKQLLHLGGNRQVYHVKRDWGRQIYKQVLINLTVRPRKCYDDPSDNNIGIGP